MVNNMRNATAMEDESTIRLMLAIDKVVKPCTDELHNILKETLRRLSWDDSNFTIPSTLSTELKSLERLEFFICHTAEADLFSFEDLQYRLEKARADVIGFCTELIKSHIQSLCDKVNVLTSKLNSEQDNLMDMKQNLSQLPVDNAITVFTDVYSSLKRGVSHDMFQNTALTLDKKNSLSSKIKVAKKNIESNSLERHTIQRQVRNLRMFQNDINGRANYPNLLDLANVCLTLTEIELYSKQISSIRADLLGVILARGPSVIKNNCLRIHERSHDLPTWILSEGKTLQKVNIVSLHHSIIIHDQEKTINHKDLLKHANPLLILSGPEGSGKTVLAQQIVECYLGSSVQDFDEVSKFDLVLYLPTSVACKFHSFLHYITWGIFFYESSKRRPTEVPGDLFEVLSQLRVLFVIDFDCGLKRSVEEGIRKLLSSLNFDSKVLVTCRPSCTQAVESLAKATNILCTRASLEPLPYKDVFNFSSNCLSTIYPRSSGVGRLAASFTDSLDFESQSSLLYPFTLIYLLKAWKDKSKIVSEIFTRTDLFKYFYDNCQKNVRAKQGSIRMNYPKEEKVSSTVFTTIEEEAVERLFSLSGSTGYFSQFQSPSVTYQPVYPFVICFNHFASGVKCNKLFFAHHVLIEFLAAAHLVSQINSLKTWTSFNRKLYLPKVLQSRQASSDCGFLSQTYGFLCSLVVSSSVKFQSQRIHELVSLYEKCHGAQGPDAVDWASLLIETKFNPLVASGILRVNKFNNASWEPSKSSKKQNTAMAVLIRHSAVSFKKVFITGIELGLEEVLKAIATQPNMKVFCKGQYQVDKVISAFSQKSNLVELQGVVEERGARSVRYLQGLKILELTVLSYEALVQLANSLQISAVRKNLERFTLNISCRVEATSKLPELQIGKAKFVLGLNGYNLDVPGAAVRILKELACPCEELVISNMTLPSSVSRSIREKVRPTLVTIKTIYQKPTSDTSSC